MRGKPGNEFPRYQVFTLTVNGWVWQGNNRNEAEIRADQANLTRHEQAWVVDTTSGNVVYSKETNNAQR